MINVTLNLIFNRVSENITLKKLKLKNCYLGNTEVNNTLENYYSKSILKKQKSNNKNRVKNNKSEFDKKENVINEKEEYNIINENEKDYKNEIKNNIKNIININNIKNDNNIKNEENMNVDTIIDNFSSDKDKNIKDNEIYNKNHIEDFLRVESLDLGYNFINYKKLDKIILSNHIKELNIEGNDLHLWGDDIFLFFDFIINNKVLEILNLNKNNLQMKANKLLEKMNNYNDNNYLSCSLKILTLEDNQIKDINLELTNLLSNNKNLERLDLQNNLINDEIANNYFFHSLFKSKLSKIKEINISDNKISLKFLEKIIKYSKENIIEKNNFVLNITSKDIREAYLNSQNKDFYQELYKLKTIKCL